MEPFDLPYEGPRSTGSSSEGTRIGTARHSRLSSDRLVRGRAPFGRRKWIDAEVAGRNERRDLLADQCELSAYHYEHCLD